MVKVCIVGCLHGQLDRVYDDIRLAEERGNFKTDLVLCCGDFESLRNPADLASMSVPPKYYSMGEFWRYYSEETRAPILTIFVGGNHEASCYLQELPYGGWVAPNIWYMGYAGVVQFHGLRIAGLSGIYKPHDYTMCHYEHPPYTEATKRSVYHIRNLDVFRLGQIRRPIDILLSHDWPRGIYHYGNLANLKRSKPYLRDDIQSDSLGSPAGEQLLCHLKPKYWFAAHLHCKFSALVQHKDSNGLDNKPQLTRFLALDKCLPGRNYIQFVDIEPDNFCSMDLNLVMVSSAQSLESIDESSDRTNLYLDPEWLCILKLTNHLMSINKVPCILPEIETTERCNFSPTDEELITINEPFGKEFNIPNNFERTAPVYKPEEIKASSNFKGPNSCFRNLIQQSNHAANNQRIFSNPQTELLCAMLELTNPNAALLGQESYNFTELYTHLNTKNNEDDEEDEDEEGQDKSVLYFEDSEAHGATEYDPMDSTFNSDASRYLTNAQSLELSHNPEELVLNDEEDDDDLEN